MQGKIKLLFSAALLALATNNAGLAQAPAPSAPAVAAAPMGSNGVLSYADRLSRTLPAVGRIVVLGTRGGETQVLGSGSGAVIDAARGLVVTNAHVVRGGTTYRVEFPDGSTADAQLVGSDDLTDVAVLRIQKAGLTEILLADSNQVRTGDLVFAVGYPLSLEQTVTMGIISGIGRSGVSRDNLEDFIQTDAAINSGNSGGPLVDSQGRMVGVNTAILSPSGGNIGIGFAVPTRIVRLIVEQLVRNGSVRRGVIGVAIAPEPEQRGSAAVTNGAVIAEVTSGSGAAAGGLRSGDRVIVVDGRPIRNGRELRTAVGLLEVGASSRFTVMRGAQELQLTVQVRAPEVQTASSAGGQSGAAPASFGVRFRDLQPQDGLPEGATGAVIAAVIDRSAAAQAGLLPGDVVIAANSQRVRNASELAQMLAQIAGPIQLTVARGNSLLPVRLR